MRSRYAAFEESLRIVDDAHDSANVSAMGSGIVLSDEIDYRVLCLTFAMESPYKGTWAEEALGEPSMKTFYENLERIVQGQRWFYKEACDMAYRELHLTHETEILYFIALCTFLTYDYFGIFPSSEFDEGSYVMRIKDKYGAAMPATQFLRLYQSGRLTEDFTDRFRLRRETRNTSIFDFMENFHK